MDWWIALACPVLPCTALSLSTAKDQALCMSGGREVRQVVSKMMTAAVSHGAVL